MRLTILTLNLLVASAALAQPRAITRPMPKAPPASTTPPPAAKITPSDAAVCESRRNVLGGEEFRYNSFQSELAGVDAELAAVTRRLDELRLKREDIKRNVAFAEKRFKKYEEVYKRECHQNEGCGMYETQASSLGTQTQSLESELDLVRNETRHNREAVQKLEQRIAPLQREYADKRCTNLVPGETQQDVIDRCTNIFSDWNRMQAELNRQNNRVPELRSRYEQLFAELKNLERRATVYEGYLSANCTASAETARMRGYSDRRTRAQSIGQELDSLINDLTKLKGVKITVTTN